MSSRPQRLEVTGITINDFPNIKRRFIDAIRGALHAWELHGYDLAQAEWEKRVNDGLAKPYEKRPWKRQTRIRFVPSLMNVLWGKLLYVRMVRGKEDLLYMRLAKRYNALCEYEKSKGVFSFSQLPVDSIVRNRTSAEDAVFVVEWIGDYKIPGLEITEPVCSQGTAFAYKDVGIITCDHVLRFSGELQGQHSKHGQRIETDFESKDVVNASLTITNPTTGQTWSAKSIHRDANFDLAIIQFNEATPPHHHFFIAMDKPIQEPEHGVLIGFPNHSVGKRANFLDENVLNRYVRSALDRFDITGAGSIRQGNSGGPFVDASFRVAGIAQQGAKHDIGNDECLCVTALDRWIHEWRLSSSPPSQLNKN